jgi:hypothetical protein
MDWDSNIQKGEVGDFDFNTVFKQPHETPKVVRKKREDTRNQKRLKNLKNLRDPRNLNLEDIKNIN